MGILFFFVKISLLAWLVAQLLKYRMRRRARAAHRSALLELQKLATQTGLELVRGKLVVEGHGLPALGGPPNHRGPWAFDGGGSADALGLT